MTEQNTEQLKKIEEIKKEFEVRFNIVKDSDGYWFRTQSNRDIDATKVWDFFLHHFISLISSQHEEIKREDLKETGLDELWGMWYECPKCGKDHIVRRFKYCPDCGVKIVSLTQSKERRG